jgi:hypothetical protein
MNDAFAPRVDSVENLSKRIKATENNSGSVQNLIRDFMILGSYAY